MECFASAIPLQLSLFELQLQHDCIQFHVEVVGPLQLPLIVLTDVQSMPEKTKITHQVFA